MWVNTYNVSDTAAPFGGYKQSGFGREMSAHALEHYTQVKMRLDRPEPLTRITHSLRSGCFAGAPNSRSSIPAPISSVTRSARCHGARRQLRLSPSVGGAAFRRGTRAGGRSGAPPAICWRPFSASSRARSRCTRTSRSRWRSWILFRFDGPAPQIVMTDLEFPTNMYVFEGFRRYGAEVVYVPSAIASDRISSVARRDRRATRCWCPCRRAVPERLHPGRAGDREGAPGRRARDPRRLPGGRDRAPRHRRAGRRLRRRRIGEVAVRRSRCGISVCAPGSRAHAAPGVDRLGGARGAVRLRTGPVDSPRAPERFQSGTPNMPALYAARAGYEIVAAIGVAAIRASRWR